ncbi:substrate-binding periplasmic protein [Marinomonas ostreistagni]|uniref:Transporter substrate-binding domain-containing protein n=1 Tax=Marinomonas ostreistagni TaxID=359209 RepID=A0ABS0ZAR0_9GAMM|nr:transporter substrate-binding domain-containing protein [Marinomonas ostreistagni]MBJ7550313.1 transporter substrate-binding domain-containing protein [Marinomonas ostreistagni]
MASVLWLSCLSFAQSEQLSIRQPLQGLSIRQPLQGLSVRICGTPAYPPVSWVSPNGQVQGVNAAVIRALLQPLGVQVDDQQNSNWRRCLKEVELGNVDIISGFRTEARQNFMTFLDTPVINESIYLYYPVDAPVSFSSWEDLAGLRVGVLMGDSFGDGPDEALRRYPVLEQVSTQNQNLLKLADKRLDAVPMGKLSGQLQIASLGLQGRIGYTATDVSDYWYVGVSNRSPLHAWLPELNERLRQILKSPALIRSLLQRQQALYLDSEQSQSKEAP